MVAAAVVGCVSLAPGSAAGGVEVVYDLTAAADGVRASVFAHDFLVVPDLLDVGIPSAQATTNSATGSAGFAGNPYPGGTVVTAHDLASGVIQSNTGQDVDVPGYPLFVHSSGTHRDARVEQQGYSLKSHSDDTSSESVATAGLSADQGSVGRIVARASTDGDPSAKVATASSESDVQGLTINDVLRFGRVHSVATVEVSSDGKVKRSSDLALADTTVAGQRVAITPKGVEAAGQAAGLPSSDQLNDALQQAGVSVRYLAPEQTAKGVVSAGIEVTAVHKDPTGGSNATFAVRYVLGRASAAAGGSAQDFGDGSLGPIGPGVSTPTGTGTGQSGTAAAPSTPESVPAPADAPRVGEAPAGAPPPAVAAVPPQEVQARLMAWPSDLGGVGIYLTLMFVALATFAGGTLMRLLGVRAPWVS